jgi:hypothetical protein
MQGRGIGAGLPHAIPTLGYELEFAMRANLMFRSHNCLGEVAPPGRYFYCLVDGGGNTDNANAFGEWDKFTEGCEGITGSPSAMRKDKGVHEFIGPCVLDLKGLLVLERL